MSWYHYIALAAIVSQLVFLAQCYRNYRYALIKYKKRRSSYKPTALVIVPCKGLEPDFQENIASFFHQDYENYILWFVVEQKSDPAYQQLCKIKDQLSKSCKAQDVQILVAGSINDKSSKAKNQNSKIDLQPCCSQKIHNLLYCYEKIIQSDNSEFLKKVEVLVFADSDICVRTDWLAHLVYPLRKSKHGIATGYRWFIPKTNNLASLVLSAVNAKIAALLGDTIFNQAWGGSMAIRLELFQKLKIDKIWRKTISDDLSISYAVKKAGKKVIFVPAALVASFESTSWRELFSFARRQFLITRIVAPKLWWFGLASSLYSILGLWGAGFASLLLPLPASRLFAAVSALFFIAGLTRAIMRQRMAYKLLQYKTQYSSKVRAMKLACLTDIIGFWIWSLLLLSFIIYSACGRIIHWRGIYYKLAAPTKIIVVKCNNIQHPEIGGRS